VKRKRRGKWRRRYSPDLQECEEEKEDPRVTVRIANQKKKRYKKMKVKRGGGVE
jgi:hypothetical protein